jgi:hypothetical protein
MGLRSVGYSSGGRRERNERPAPSRETAKRIEVSWASPRNFRRTLTAVEPNPAAANEGAKVGAAAVVSLGPRLSKRLRRQMAHMRKVCAHVDECRTC